MSSSRAARSFGSFRNRAVWQCLRQLVIASAGLCTVLSAFPTSASSSVAPPQVLAYPSTQSVGRSVTVVGLGFPPGSAVQLQVCGNDALDGSADCVLNSSTSVMTSGDGRFHVPLFVTDPPKPCPCVVLAVDSSAPYTPTAPLTIVGAPVATPSASSIRPLEVLNAHLEGNGPWDAWFGGAPQRTLVVTVHNPNAASDPEPPLTLAVGQRSTAGAFDAITYGLPTLGPNATKIYRVHVALPVFSVGNQQVAATVGANSTTRAFVVRTKTYPWGLIVVLLVILELVLFGIAGSIRERGRRRQARASGGDQTQTPPAADLAA